MLDRFNGYLKQMTAETLNDLGRAVVGACAPRFGALSPEKLAELRARTVQAAERRPYVTHWTVPTEVVRRWSGDLIPGMKDGQLGRGNYFTLCDAEGDDGGTLVGELNAYRDPTLDFYVLFLDPKHYDIAPSFGLPPSPVPCVLVSPPHALLVQMERLGLDPPADLVATRERPMFVVSLGASVSPAKIDGVIDLRHPEVQRWFFDRYVPVLLPTDAEDFAGILPELTRPEIGGWPAEGSGRTQMIGAQLRKAGVQGVIFPSARANSYVSWSDGEIVAHGGWSMVIYPRDQPPLGSLHLDLGGWLTKFPPGVRVERSHDPEGRPSGWQVSGFMDVNMFAYELAMESKGLGLSAIAGTQRDTDQVQIIDDPPK